VDGGAIDAGHFFPEEVSELTAAALTSFFGAIGSAQLGVLKPPSPRR
jgi:hypothetical protein